jgi:hypothetical protein
VSEESNRLDSLEVPAALLATAVAAAAASGFGMMQRRTMYARGEKNSVPVGGTRIQEKYAALQLGIELPVRSAEQSCAGCGGCPSEYATLSGRLQRHYHRTSSAAAEKDSAVELLSACGAALPASALAQNP